MGYQGVSTKILKQTFASLKVRQWMDSRIYNNKLRG